MVVTIVIGSICGAIAMLINASKNRGNKGLAFASGFFFGVIGIIVNACLPSVPEKEVVVEDNELSKKAEKLKL